MHSYLQLKIRVGSKLSSRVALSTLALWLGSCSLQEKSAQIDPFAAINPVQKFNPFAPDSPLASSIVSQWEQEFSQPGFFTPGDHWHTKEGRNELVYRLIFMADYRFFRYERDLTTGRAAGDTIVDMAVLGLSSAGAITPAGQATRILAAISGGLIGSRAALQKNFFENQTTTVLLDRMRVLRKERFNQIVANLQLPYESYPVELAIIEVFDYYNRGTMLGAIQDISTNTGIKQITAEGGQVTLPPSTPPVSQLIKLSLPKAVSGTNGHLRTTKLPPDVRAGRKSLGDAVAMLRKRQDGVTAARILDYYGEPSPRQDGAAIERLGALVDQVTSKKELVPLEHAFDVILSRSADQSAHLPEDSSLGKPLSSPTPAIVPTPHSVPTSSPHDAPKTDGSL